MKLQLLTILICGLLLALAQPTWARKWTDNTGKFSVEAELVEVKDDKVVLKRTSGSVITVPVARLSETDRQYLQALAEEPTHVPVRPAPEVIAAWEKAGARFFFTAEDVSFFLFNRTPTERLDVLPPPQDPSGFLVEDSQPTRG